LANPGVEYLLYQHYPKAFTVRLPAGTYQFEWFDPSTNRIAATGTVTVSVGEHEFTAPFAGDAVLYLHASAP